MATLRYDLEANWITIKHSDWSKLFIHEDIVLKNFINRSKKWVFISSQDMLQSWDTSNSFFTWMKWKFPEINRISSYERDELLEIYKKETWDKSFISPDFFNLNLPAHVKSKKVSVRWETIHWYYIEDGRKAQYFP